MLVLNKCATFSAALVRAMIPKLSFVSFSKMYRLQTGKACQPVKGFNECLLFFCSENLWRKKPKPREVTLDLRASGI